MWGYCLMDIYSLLKREVGHVPQKGMFDGWMSKLWGWKIEVAPKWKHNKKIGSVALHWLCGSWQKQCWSIQKKMSRVEYKKSRPSELISYLKPQLGDFIIHNYVFKWQEKELKYYLQHMPQEIVVSCIDFSENYVFRV